MANVFSFLSGNVPGGIFILTVILFVINLTLYFLVKKSGLFAEPVYRKKLFQFNLPVVILYISLWIALKPPVLPPSVLIVPFQKGDTIDFALTEALEEQVASRISDHYRLHPWEWFYLSADQDSFNQPAYRNSLAGRLKIGMIISGNIIVQENSGQVRFEIYSSDRHIQSTVTFASYPQVVQLLMAELEQKTDLVDNERQKSMRIPPVDYETLCRAKLAYLNKEYARARQILAGDGDSLYQSHRLQARCLLQEWILNKKIEKYSMPFSQEEVHPFFRQIERLLLPYSIRGEDTAEINLILGQMYLYRQDFETASICLKKAFIQNRYDSRIFYYLSFLLAERLEEMGYKSRAEVLERSVELDPGYVDAILELSNYLYGQSSGSPSALGTRRALEILESFLSINPYKPQILIVLGKIYLQTKEVQRAIGLFERVLVLEPGSADNYYNLGICYFNNKEYQKAQGFFEQAIRKGDHLDSYLYMGAIYRLQEDLEKALFYYRERVKRKTGDDDYYAREAMKGIRLILEKQQPDSTAGVNTASDSVRSSISD
jgi:tetratricopeptide (TPR) repeat protein